MSSRLRLVSDRNVESLSCPLTDEEFSDRSSQLARVCEAIDNLEDAQKQQKAAMKAEQARLEADRSALAMAVRRKAETRDVQVSEFADDDSGFMLTIRADTGEIVRKRRLTMDERQIPLPMPDSGQVVGTPATVVPGETSVDYAARRTQELADETAAVRKRRARASRS